MSRPALIGLFLYSPWAVVPAQQAVIERLVLEVNHPQARVEIVDDTFYRLSTATTSVTLEGKLVDIYRWTLSARDTSRVTVRLVDAQWEPVGTAPAAFLPRPLLRVHSPQVWGQLRVVVLDLLPWRISNDRLEVLKAGAVELSIRQDPGDPGVATEGVRFGSTPVANSMAVPAGRRRQPSLQRATAARSVAGTWLKIPLTEDGLYHLTVNYLSAAGLAVDALDPARLRLLAPAQLGRPMSNRVGTPREENLVELAIQVRDGGDGRLDDGDDILFYGQGPRGFDLVDGNLAFVQHPYTNEAYVWLHIPTDPDIPDGLRMAQGRTYATSENVITTGRSRYHHEIDAFNGFDSGPEWYQTPLSKGTSLSIPLITPQLRSADSTFLELRIRGGAGGSHRVELSLNQALLIVSSRWSAHNTILLAPAPSLVAGAIVAGDNLITLTNVSTYIGGEEDVWLDWAELDYGLDLVATDDGLTFLMTPQEPGDIALAGFSNQPVVVDITDPARPVIQQLQSAGVLWQFTPTDLAVSRRYVAATQARLSTPGAPASFQDLDFATLRRPDRRADYIIITHPSLLSAAEDLAKIHSEEVRPEWRLRTLVTTVDKIYQEFSGGVADPFAIRAFLRYAYENWQSPAPRLVALFGDGDFDYRNISGRSTILVPTIQVDGRDEIDSRSADDRFVYLDSTYVETPLPDMGIGRIAAATLEEAMAAVNAVRSYLVDPEPGAWRQRVLLAADDPVRPNDRETSFVIDTEFLSDRIPTFLQLDKIYLTEYAQIIDPATNTVIKPDATSDLIRRINQGVALINYIGHGSSTQWAQERLLKMERDRSLLITGRRLPIWYAGTCTWGRFDQLETPSMSEVLTASLDIGGIAVISATRAVYSSRNTAFVKRLFNQTFPGKKPSLLRMGEIFQGSKLGEATDEKFHLFGDPALFMAFPREPLTLNAVTSGTSDTLKVLGTATYSGTTDAGGLISGETLVTVLDAPRRVTRTYRSKDGTFYPISYTLPGAPIFRGAATLSNGSFQGQFVIPKDINYSGNPASLIAYSWSDEHGILLEQIGARSDLLILGTEPDTLDSTGPLVTVFYEGRPVVSGDALPEGAEVEVELKDPLGINLMAAVGHAIRLWVDDESAAETMDPLFRYDTDSHTTGRFAYVFDPALTGRHELNLVAWDGANNKTQTVIIVHLVLDREMDVADLFNYPNPFQNFTDFVYTLSLPAQVTITVYTLNGVKVVTLESMGDQSGFQRLPWDGRDYFGDQIANGAYLYRFQAEAIDGATITRWGRLARLR